MQPCQWFQRLSKIPTLTSNMYMISCHMDYFSNIIQTQQIMFGSLQHLSIGYRLFKPKTMIWYVGRFVPIQYDYHR